MCNSSATMRKGNAYHHFPANINNNNNASSNGSFVVTAAKHRVAKAACATERTMIKHRIGSSSNNKTSIVHTNHHPTRATNIRRSVRFNGTVKVCIIRPVAVPKGEMEDDASNTWYSPLEYKNFQRDSKSSLKAVTSNLCGVTDAYDSNEHCLRGLEACLSSQIYQLRKEEKSTIVNEVLNQQLLQRLLGLNDPENLAQLSQGLSKQAQRRALLLAALDSPVPSSSSSSSSLSL